MIRVPQARHARQGTIEIIAPHTEQRTGSRQKLFAAILERRRGVRMLTGTRSPAASLSTMLGETPASRAICAWRKMPTGQHPLDHADRGGVGATQRSGGSRPTMPAAGGARRSVPVAGDHARRRTRLRPGVRQSAARAACWPSRRSIPATTVAVISRCRIIASLLATRDCQRVTVGLRHLLPGSSSTNPASQKIAAHETNCAQ